MDPENGRPGAIPERDKVPGLPYVFTDTGLELPVLDITHPFFEQSIDEGALAAQRAQSATLAALVRAMPETQRKAITERSYIWGTHFTNGTATSYLSGLGTYMLKLGPRLLGGGDDRESDRRATMGVGGIAARMRLRDLCRGQAEALIPLLAAHPGAPLRLLNIAGGAAADTINTLRLVLRRDAALLWDRKIAIDLMEIDTIGPHFAERSLAALQKAGKEFGTLDLVFRFHHNSWDDAAAWAAILEDGGPDIVLCSSEGGLFEYGTNEEIGGVLDVLAGLASVATVIIGSCLLDRETIDPTIPALADTSGSALRFFGRSGLEALLEPTPWHVEWLAGAANPVYLLFTLRKR